MIFVSRLKVDDVETRDCEFVSKKKCQRPKETIYAKNLKSTHACEKPVEQIIKTSTRGQEFWMSYVKYVSFHQTVIK